MAAGGARPAADLSTSPQASTTGHLIGDMEKPRGHLGIGRWLVWGGSRGVTLGLACAGRYPERVTEMVLVSCTMTRPGDVHWLYHEAGRFFPGQWQRYRQGGGNAGDLVAAYDHLLSAAGPRSLPMASVPIPETYRDAATRVAAPGTHPFPFGPATISGSDRRWLAAVTSLAVRA